MYIRRDVEMSLFCCLCAKDLEAGNRRTLNPKAGENNRRVVEFLAEYVFEGSHPDFGPKCFACRACFSEAAKSERALLIELSQDESGSTCYTPFSSLSRIDCY